VRCSERGTAERPADEAEDLGRIGLARNRTELAEDRTVLAHERSFAGWVRTGMASVGIGIGFHALFDTMQPGWVPRAIATVFLAIAIFIFLSSASRACRILARLDAHQVSTLRPMKIRLLSWGLSLATAALTPAIWLLAPS